MDQASLRYADRHRRLPPRTGQPHGGTMESNCWDAHREIRSLIQRPEKALNLLHKPIGVITLRKFVYRGEAGFVFQHVTDENGKDRFVGFSGRQLSTLPFAMRRKNAN